MPVLTAACDLCGSTVDVHQCYDIFLCGYHQTESDLRDAKRDLSDKTRLALHATGEQQEAQASVVALERKVSTLTKPT